MLNDLITEARELCSKATRGPWEVNLHNEDYGQGYGETTFFVNIGGTLLKIGIADTAEKYTEYSTLSTFIARSRTLIPELCDALEKATAKNDELIRELSELARESGCVYCINSSEKITAMKERYSHATETGIAYDNIKVNFCPMCGKRLEE